MAQTAAASDVGKVYHATEPYVAPTANGGSQLTNAYPGSTGGYYGEPLNVIISGQSSPEVLTSQGFLQYSHALGFSYECFNLHSGVLQTANLGDGRGWQPQVVEYREDYDSALLGTCFESFKGGNHLRMWRQEGPTAKTGALFLAVSREEDVLKQHMLVPNGYDVGRDSLVQYATEKTRQYSDMDYTTTAQTLAGLISPGNQNLNHGDTISQDGAVILLTVTAKKR